jgi:hypothetical protein
MADSRETAVASPSLVLSLSSFFHRETTSALFFIMAGGAGVERSLDAP